jgi:hypothetical protein
MLLAASCSRSFVQAETRLRRRSERVAAEFAPNSTNVGWCAWQESNLLPHAPQACALSGELQAPGRLAAASAAPRLVGHSTQGRAVREALAGAQPARLLAAMAAWWATWLSRSAATNMIVNAARCQ